MSYQIEWASELQTIEKDYGVSISSRSQDAGELSEMLRFFFECATKGVEHYLKRLFYDSNCNCCFIETKENVRYYDPIGEMLRGYAREYITQFNLFDTIGHSKSFAEQGKRFAMIYEKVAEYEAEHKEEIDKIREDYKKEMSECGQ